MTSETEQPIAVPPPPPPSAPPAQKALPQPAQATNEAFFALLLSWLAPGAGQLYLGKPRRALAFFVPCLALFGLGAMLSGGLAVELARFHWFRSDNPIVGALAVLPEMLSLGPTMFLSSLVEVTRPYPPIDPTVGFGPQLGLVLSAMGGILGAFAMADAHHQSRVGPQLRPGQKCSIRAALLSWLLPGAGQFWLGQRGKALLAGGAVLALFAMGLAFSGFTCAQRGEYYFYWAGQMLLGLPAALASLGFADAGLEEFWPKADLGLLLATSAGLLNVLLVLNAYTVGERLAGREVHPVDLRKRDVQAVDTAPSSAPRAGEEAS